MLIAPEPGCRISHNPSDAGIDWIAAPDSGDRSGLDRWCAGVGPAVLAGPTNPDGLFGSNGPFDLPEPIDSLAVISWNTHVGGGDIAGLVASLEAGTLTGGNPVRHFVLLLQEVYRQGSAVPVAPQADAPRRISAAPPDGNREDIVTAATRLGLHFYYVPSMANGHPEAGEQPEDRGNAILSTLPLTDPAAIELPFEAQRRVAATATISGMSAQGRVWELRLVSVHLDHRSRIGRLFQSLGGGRARQARALVEALPGERIVLGGDLNTWSFASLEGAIDVLETHFPLPEAAPDEPTFGTSSGLGGMRLDRMMFRVPDAWAGPVERIDDPFGSDHHPLLGWITPGR